MFQELNAKIDAIDQGVEASFFREKKQLIGIKSGLKQVSDLARELERKMGDVVTAGAELGKRVRTIEAYLMRGKVEVKPTVNPTPRSKVIEVPQPEPRVVQEDPETDLDASSDYEH